MLSIPKDNHSKQLYAFQTIFIPSIIFGLLQVWEYAMHKTCILSFYLIYEHVLVHMDSYWLDDLSVILDWSTSKWQVGTPGWQHHCYLEICLKCKI